MIDNNQTDIFYRFCHGVSINYLMWTRWLHLRIAGIDLNLQNVKIMLTCKKITSENHQKRICLSEVAHRGHLLRDCSFWPQNHRLAINTEQFLASSMSILLHRAYVDLPCSMFHLQISPAKPLYFQKTPTKKNTRIPKNVTIFDRTWLKSLTHSNFKSQRLLDSTICRICDEKVGIEKWYLSLASLTLDRSTKKIQKMQNEYLKHCLNDHWILFG